MLEMKHKDEANDFVLDAIPKKEQLEMDGISVRSEEIQQNKPPIFNENFICTKWSNYGSLLRLME